jgi:hypothetical protein
MKVLKPLTLLTVLLVFTACDDDWIMDLEPPYGGYIWRVSNGCGGTGIIRKYDPVDGSYIEGYSTPFAGGEEGYPPTYHGYGYNYDAAAGDGRVWVAGDKLTDGLPYPYIWELGSDDFRIPYFGFGLTYDGEYLWINDYGDYEGITLTEFYRLDPDTHVQELMFIFDSGKLPIRGLAWDGTCLWALFAPGWGGGTEGDKVFVQFDPETGDVLHRAPCNIEVPLGLTWDGEALWVNDAKSDRLYRVSPDDGSILGYHEMSPPGRLPPPCPYGLAFEFPSE